MELLKQSTVEYRYLDTKIFIILVNLYIFSLILLGKWLNRWIDLLNDC